MRDRATVIKAVLALGCLSGLALGGSIGRPTSLDISIWQGSEAIVGTTHVDIPAWDPLNGLNYIPIGTSPDGKSTLYFAAWVYNTEVPDGPFGFVVRASTPNNPLIPGDGPLFDMSGSGDINVYIDNLTFKTGSTVNSLKVEEFDKANDGDYSAAFYQLDSNGWFYETPLSTPFGSSWKMYEVSHSAFRDADTSHYNFIGDIGSDIDIAWNNVYSPVDTNYMLAYPGSPYPKKADTSGGAVFEIGMAAYAWHVAVPEPVSIALLMLGAIPVIRRVKR